MEFIKRHNDKVRAMRGLVTYHSGTKRRHRGLNHLKVDEYTFACGSIPDLFQVTELMTGRHGEPIYPVCKRCQKHMEKEGK